METASKSSPGTVNLKHSDGQVEIMLPDGHGSVHVQLAYQHPLSPSSLSSNSEPISSIKTSSTSQVRRRPYHTSQLGYKKALDRMRSSLERDKPDDLLEFQTLNHRLRLVLRRQSFGYSVEPELIEVSEMLDALAIQAELKTSFTDLVWGPE